MYLYPADIKHLKKKTRNPTVEDMSDVWYKVK